MRMQRTSLLFINGQLTKFITSTKSLDTMGDYYDSRLVTHFRQFSYECFIKVNSTFYLRPHIKEKIVPGRILFTLVSEVIIIIIYGTC